MEFHPVIMAAGHGSRMTDLTANTPKALLPLGNLPMIWYPIKMLQKAGFETAIVIVQESTKDNIESTLRNLEVKMKLEFVSVPDNADWGTADSLRHIHERIKPHSDLLVLSCDLLTNVQLHCLADIHRTYDAAVTMLLTSQSVNMTEQSVPGHKTKRTAEKEFIGMDSQQKKVVFMASEADLDESLSIRKSLLKRHPCLTIHTKLSDAHLYLIKRWVIDYLIDNKNISTIKGELIPHLVKKQFSKPPATHNESDLPNPNASVMSVDTRQDIYSYLQDSEVFDLAKEMSSSAHHMTENKIGCYGYVMEGGLCIRSNTLASYCEANRQVPKYLSSFSENNPIAQIHPTVTISKSQVGNDCLIGEGVTVGEKVSVKKSVIGKHCSIADKVKINNSILMDHVTVSEGCNIQGCILCDNSHINEKCELKDCIIGSSQQVIAMGKLTNEVIVNLDQMMEI